MRGYLLIAVILVACGGAALWVGRAHSRKRCHEAAFLVSQASTPERWLEAAAKDRFLTQLLHEGPLADSLRYFAARAQVLAKDSFAWHFFPEAKAAFQALANTPPASEKLFLAALQRVAALPAPCEPAVDSKLVNLLRDSENAWKLRQGDVALAKASFARDQEIYCHAESLTNRLKVLLVATEDSCAKRKVDCGPATASINQEIADIEKQKEFNKNKLRRKWSDDILGGLACS